MSWIAVATIGGSLIGSAIQSDSASDAADSQAASSADAIGEQRRQYDLTRQDFAPYREQGASALRQLSGEINQPISSADVMSDPGYQFGADQGQQALDRKFSSMGGRASGAALKSAARFGTNYASTGYGAAYQRRQDRMNRLAALAGIGQTATGASAAAGAGAANQISGLMANQGDAQGASQLARGSIWGNTTNQLAALYGRSGSQTTDRSGFRSDDPYSNPLYYGGGEGE